MRSTTGTLIGVLAVLATLQVAFVTAAVWGDPILRATMLMATGLLILWVAGFGLFCRLARDRICDWAGGVLLPRRAKFVAFATVLALLEEAVTTSMTNLAPVFGVPLGAAFVTASTNYVDVVLGHSVIVFVPMFAAWAWLLERWRFTPNAVLLLFGLTGTFAEAGTFGVQNLASAPFWILVYGLMVYLPAFVVGHGSRARAPRLNHYFLAVVLPILAAIPVALVVSSIHPGPHHFGKP